MDMELFCTNKRYRRHITELAASLFHHRLWKPTEDADPEEVDKYARLTNLLEQEVTTRANALSRAFEVPVDIVHYDINECVDFLPKDDLRESFKAKEENKLH